jgi:preprotein translocase subunit SecY
MSLKNIKGQNLFEEDTFVRRVGVTLGIIAILRIGASIPVPGIEQASLALEIKNQTFLNVFSLFSQGRFFVLGLFSLGILPNINASLAMQFLTFLLPFLQKLQKLGGTAGQTKITRYTRILTLIIALQYSIVISLSLESFRFKTAFSDTFELVLILTTGSLITMWLSEFLSQYGFGKGSSLFIFVNIISSVPLLLSQIKNPFLTFLFISLILIGIIYVQEAYARIPLVSAKELLSPMDSQSDFSYIPFTLNPGGVIPIIFASSISTFPGLSFLNKLLLGNSIFGLILFFGLILSFNILYASIILNPIEIAEKLKEAGCNIVDKRPGLMTVKYLKQVFNRLSVLGGIFLAGITIFSNLFLPGLGATSLIILVGVAIDLNKQLRAIFISNYYQGL